MFFLNDLFKILLINTNLWSYERFDISFSFSDQAKYVSFIFFENGKLIKYNLKKLSQYMLQSYVGRVPI